jgi:oligopeptide/dipeptide ABC transporter ATP-binding protein
MNTLPDYYRPYRNWEGLVLYKGKHPILELKNVTKQFGLDNGKKITAVDTISLKLDAGECLGIAGESGCGKSTIAKMITRLESVTSGSILYNGKDITGLRGEELRQNRRRIQLVFQDPAATFDPRMRIGDSIGEPILNFRLMNKEETRVEVVKLLAMVGLSGDFRHRYPHQLSGGELQRAAIARALSVKPEIVVCDEATSALDVSVQAQVLRLLADLQRQWGLTYIFIGHDLATVRNMSHRIALMYRGRVVEIIDGEIVARYAAHPYTKELLAAVFSVKDGNQNEFRIIEGEPSGFDHAHSGCGFYYRCRQREEWCLLTQPELREVGDNHFVACHLT